MSVRRVRDPSHPWEAILADGSTIGCESLPQARAIAGCPPIDDPTDPVHPEWFREFLAQTDISAPTVASLLRLSDDRLARRWKAGDATPPWNVAELLAAWADSRPPRLEK